MEDSQKHVRDIFFPHRYEQRFFTWYRRICSIHEIEESKVLQWFFGATLFSFLATFYPWISTVELTVQRYLTNQHLCWPYFQSCGQHFFLEALPYGYSQTTFYAILLGLMLCVVYFMYRKDWVLAHMAMVPLFAWKFLSVFVLTMELAGNFDYYHMIFSIVLLFFPLKLFFLKLIAVLLYTLSATAKIHETWIVGTYFSVLHTGIPIFPDWSIPVWTNLVILMQIVGTWLLMGRNMFLQRFALIYFILFHLYSVTLVSYRYPLTILPSIIILFGMWYAPEKVPLTRKSIVGWLFVALLVALQLWSIVIPGDERVTGEGNRYGLYMFEANHQCVSKAQVYKTDGTVTERNQGSNLARNRCEVYEYWFQFNELCRKFPEEVQHISWTFDHSINGGAFYRIVDTENVCALEYNALWHNEWILDTEEAEIIGYPVRNFYF